MIDDFGKIYVFGGVSDSGTGSNTNVWHNDITIFDSNKLAWISVNPQNPPTMRSDFTATYLPNSKLIIYIGGREIRADGFLYDVNIKEVALFFFLRGRKIIF